MVEGTLPNQTHVPANKDQGTAGTTLASVTQCVNHALWTSLVAKLIQKPWQPWAERKPMLSKWQKQLGSQVRRKSPRPYVI